MVFDHSAFDALLRALTPRERDVMPHVACGVPNKQIAQRLGISQRTIEAHRASLLRKLRVRNAAELGVICATYGVVRLPYDTGRQAMAGP